MRPSFLRVTLHRSHDSQCHGWDLRSEGESRFPPVSSFSSFLSTTQLFINSENTPSSSQKTVCCFYTVNN